MLVLHVLEGVSAQGETRLFEEDFGADGHGPVVHVVEAEDGVVIAAALQEFSDGDPLVLFPWGALKFEGLVGEVREAEACADELNDVGVVVEAAKVGGLPAVGTAAGIRPSAEDI